MPKTTSVITVDSSPITIISDGDNDFISLTDMAKSKDWEVEPRYTITRWMSNRNTLEFLSIWEELHNPSFKRNESVAVKKDAGLNSFNLSPKRWIESTRAIGIKSKAGKYGGTYAHKDIAFEFGMWISPRFKLLLIKEFQRLKESESKRLNQHWNYSRFLAKANYKIHTDAIKDVLVPLSVLPENLRGIVYADEAELLNMALFNNLKTVARRKP